MLFQLLVGLALGALFVLFARKGGERESLVFALGLVVAAVIYVGFALAGAPLGSLLLESLGVFPFGLVAWLVRRSQLWLAFGWAAHVAWDLGLNWGAGALPFVPSWYPVVCTSFDLLVAGYIAGRSRANGLDTIVY